MLKRERESESGLSGGREGGREGGRAGGREGGRGGREGEEGGRGERVCWSQDLTTTSHNSKRWRYQCIEQENYHPMSENKLVSAFPLPKKWTLSVKSIPSYMCRQLKSMLCPLIRTQLFRFGQSILMLLLASKVVYIWMGMQCIQGEEMAQLKYQGPD